MRSCYFLWMLVIVGLISTMAYSKTNAPDNFLLLHYSSHSVGFQHIPLPASTGDPNTYAPVIYNTEQNHFFTVTSLPGSPATTITLFFDDAVELVTFESGISVTVSQIRNNKYQVDINLSASKQGRTRAFSLTGAGTLDIEKNKVNGQPRQLKPLFNGSQHKGVKKTTTTAEQWGHIVRYQGQLKSDLYSEQQAWLQQPTPSTAVVMIVIKKDAPSPPAANEGENTQSGSESGTGDQPPTSTQEADPASNNSDDNTADLALYRTLQILDHLIGMIYVSIDPIHFTSRPPEEKNETKDTTTTSQSCDSEVTKEDSSRDKKEDPDDPSGGKPFAVN
ncbi:hypothetical protein [Endozoicomonas euniceicola]|uniref:Uncharacterized protein n=1 Tax=Endozoicomonas euniceicola TaxID=1234143 RepID=A0ABY6GP40_9GAMM|nr:hypothetical protein [Endozoicomonas euniceicola]UYM14184.1 hypothetical protein NX720_14855 [Endozoicomonas euniceicola]